MGLFRLNRTATLDVGISPIVSFAILAAITATAQDIKLNVTYVCNGERIYVESCNIRSTADNAGCTVAHPDRPTRNGIMAYTNETRGALKALLPTCKQPTPQELAAAEAFKKKQQEIYDANLAKANPGVVPQQNSRPAPQNSQNSAVAQAQAFARVAPPKNAEERAMRRCISSGRITATCTGNQLLGAFGQMVSQVLPSAAKEPEPGPDMAGVYEGPGSWRLDFIDGGVLVNCATLAPDQHAYTFEFKNNRAAIVIDTTPKPLILTMGPDGKTLTAPGPFVLDGVVVTGYDSGLRDATGRQVDPVTAVGPVYDTSGRRVSRSPNQGHASFGSRRVTCPALNLVTKGSVGVQTMGTDLLKSLFNDGDKGPPTPPGIRMHGIYAASTGFSVQFFPESVILGCGPDSARAYPYTVVADGIKSGIKIDAADRPLNLTFGPGGSLDPGTGPYQVHGRIVIGQDNNGEFTFAPLEQTCNLAPLSPSKQIPNNGGSIATPSPAAPSTSSGAPSNNGGRLSTPAAPLGNAILSIVSGLPPQPGSPNPLAGRPLVLLRDSYADALAEGGVVVPSGMSPYKYVGSLCTSRTPECQKTIDAINASAASAVRADVNGNGTFPGVPPGPYYLMISAQVNNRPLAWAQAVQLKAGTNTLKLDQSTAIPIN